MNTSPASGDLPRPSDRLRPAVGVALAVVGLALLTFGLGVGLPWAGWRWTSPAAVAGIAALVAGPVILVAGLMRVVARWRARWRAAVLVPAAVPVVVVAYAGTVAFLAAMPPPTALGAGRPADRGLAAVDVVFPAADGTRLSGWYVPSANGAAVAVLHGAHATRTAVLGQAEVLARHGFGVLLYDARGHGRSAGRPMDFGWYGESDLAGAITFLLGRPDVVGGRVAALGESMGGEEAIGALAADPRLRAVVAEGATNRTADDWRWLSERYGWRGSVTRQVHALTYGLADLLTPASPPASLAEAVRRGAPRPVLLVTAGRVPDEANAAAWIRRAAPSAVTVWTVEGAGHTAGLATRPAEWDQRVIGFLSDALH